MSNNKSRETAPKVKLLISSFGKHFLTNTAPNTFTQLTNYPCRSVQIFTEASKPIKFIQRELGLPEGEEDLNVNYCVLPESTIYTINGIENANEIFIQDNANGVVGVRYRAEW